MACLSWFIRVKSPLLVGVYLGEKMSWCFISMKVNYEEPVLYFNESELLKAGALFQ